MRRTLAGLACGVLAGLTALQATNSPAGFRQAATSADHPADLAAMVQGLVDDLHLVAVGAGIVKGGRLAWAGGAGWADREQRRPVTASTVFHMGSVSKTLTAAVLMRLLEQGRFQLDDDVNLHLSFPVRNPRFPSTSITVRMLLTHTSGISDIDQQAGGNRLSALYGTEDSSTGLGQVAREFLVPGGAYYSDASYGASAPGTRYEYSNVGYTVVGHLVERISGMSFHDYCRAQILAPLDMPDTTFRLADTRLDRFAVLYRADPADPPKTTRIAPFTWPGYTDGSLRTSLNDYSHFLSMMLNQGRYGGHQVLKAETVASWLAPQPMPPMPPSRGAIVREGYALGWPVHRLNGEVTLMHNGWGSGFATCVYVVPSKMTAGMIFVTGGAPPQALFPRLESAIIRMVEAAGKI